MKNKKIKYAYILTILTILLNLLMIFVVKVSSQNSFDNFSNIIVIIITIIAFVIYKFAFKFNQEKKATLEFFGIIFMFSMSLMRFINRATFIPDMVNFFNILIFFGIGTFFLFVAIGRIFKYHKNK